MKYFVFWIVGSCQSGDRNAGIQEFDTLADALRFKGEIEGQSYDVQVTIVHGEEITPKSS